MTTEEKAKAYDEALKWMRELYPGLHGATKEDAEHYFPELRESEDERIREKLISYLHSVNKEVGELGHPKIDMWIAYLEKQKEQKPAEVIEDRRQIAFMIEDGRRCGVIEGRKSVIDNPEMYGLQKPAEWSEEDERYINGLIGLIEDMKVGISPKLRGVTADRCIAFIKSLRPQQKYEWNEADENALIQLIENGVTKAICKTGFKFHFDDEYAKELIEYIRAFNPAPHWKPSEVQMEALAWYSGNCNIPPTGDKAIKSLYNDLKKL